MKTYQNDNQTYKAKDQKLRQEAAVIVELKRKYECSPREHMWAEEYLKITY